MGSNPQRDFDRYYRNIVNKRAVQAKNAVNPQVEPPKSNLYFYLTIMVLVVIIAIVIFWLFYPKTVQPVSTTDGFFDSFADGGRITPV
jgi:hypothetical protein